MNGDFQYIEESLLLERVLSELYNDSDELHKYAFDFTSILTNVANSIRQSVGSVVQGQGAEGVGRTVLNILAPATFFRIHPILGILVTAAQLFGFDLYTIYQKIVGAIKPSIEKGEPISADQVNNAAKSAIGTATTASLLQPLNELQKNGMVKFAAGNSPAGTAWKANPIIPKNTNPLLRMFSFLSMPKRASLIAGILSWFVKTILLSAGLLAVGGAVTGLIGGAMKPSITPANTSQQQGIAQEQVIQQPTQTVPKRDTGAGSFTYKNSPDDLWIEPLGEMQPYQKVLQWAIDSFPDLYEYKDIILRTPSFWNSVNSVTQTWKPGETQLSIPDPYKKKDDVLSGFIDDVYRQL